MSIEEISLGVGYENQSYFFRQFKKRYGMIPRRYRIEKGQKVCKLLKNSERVGMLFTLQGKRINVKVNDTVCPGYRIPVHRMVKHTFKQKVG